MTNLTIHATAPTGEEGRIFKRHHAWTVYEFRRPRKPSNPLLTTNRPLLKARKQ